ncbi:YceD family protein [Elizabethkingia meningoseptica]|uniref:YceD family protein n=1 Tax=Elizabethkingia meningoseptica TaxID=238 RepID=UPI00201271AC|nr:DUF177 domain-containing protein [Elizabethkingia meningoseptica]MCL1675262.1 DUF177 domain-containing protein [Elizabethkingia meningoseptica]MCL1687626.1 DUF177 domain-containing protein [Elizabethkingia meningoseptica]
MDKIRNYNIAFTGLKNGKHDFIFDVKQEFFNLFEIEQEFDKASLQVNVLLDKHSTFLEFEIKVEGTVQLICDISNEEFNHSISNEIKVLVKFGEEYDDSNEEVIVIPQNEYEFNIAQLIFEAVVLAIPMKKLSPNLSESDLEALDQYSPKEIEAEKENDDQNDIDPRWAALNKLKDKN